MQVQERSDLIAERAHGVRVHHYLPELAPHHGGSARRARLCGCEGRRHRRHRHTRQRERCQLTAEAAALLLPRTFTPNRCSALLEPHHIVPTELKGNERHHYASVSYVANPKPPHCPAVRHRRYPRLERRGRLTPRREHTQRHTQCLDWRVRRYALHGRRHSRHVDWRVVGAYHRSRRGGGEGEAGRGCHGGAERRPWDRTLRYTPQSTGSERHFFLADERVAPRLYHMFSSFMGVKKTTTDGNVDASDTNEVGSTMWIAFIGWR